MTFLAPSALFGALLLAIPILVHLFKPRKMRPTPFSSLRWLKQTHQRLSRRVQWHQWLLFLMRAGIITLLVLALAKPLVGSRGAGSPVDRYVVLDLGRAMGHETPGLPSPLERARETAARLMTNAGVADRTALLTVETGTRLVCPPIANAEPHVAVVRSAKTHAADPAITSALPLIRSLIDGRSTTAEAEVVFLTSNLRTSWKPADVQAFLKDLPGATRVQVVDFGPGSATNAWISEARLIDVGETDFQVLRVDLGCVGDMKQERTVRLKGPGDWEDQVPSAPLKPGQYTRVEFKVPTRLSLEGQVGVISLEPKDALPSDDVWYANLNAGPRLRVLILEAEGSKNAGAGDSLYLRAAIDALSATKGHAVETAIRSEKSVGPGDVARADVVVLAGVAELSDAIVESIERRVRGGAGVIAFLGDRAKLGFYNEKLFRPLQPTEGLSAAPLKPAAAWPSGGGIELTDVRWSHPLLAPLRDPVFDDLMKASFTRHALFAAPTGPGDAVLARFSGGEPALVEHPFGAGRVLLWNTSADDAWSDLPRRRGFVPLVDRMLSYLSAGGRSREFIAGEAIVIPVEDAKGGEKTIVKSPAGDALSVRATRHAGQTLLHVDAVDVGVYRVETGEKSWPFTVNASRASSPLAPMDPKILADWWSPVACEVIGPEAFDERLQTAGHAWPVWPVLVLLAGLLMMVESLYAHRLCPRKNPDVVDSIVPHQGVLKPVSHP